MPNVVFAQQTSRRNLLRLGIASVTLSVAGGNAIAKAIISDIDSTKLSKSRRTPLGLYLSPKAAHAALVADTNILLVDVRDPIEITFVGHPEGLDKIIPLRVATHEISPKTNQYVMQNNPDVVSNFDALLAAKGKSKDDPIFVTCRSGSRSASAARMLIKNGYTNVWNLTEGFEGDKNSNGSRAVNGWRNAGLPWGYKLGENVAWGS